MDTDAVDGARAAMLAELDAFATTWWRNEFGDVRDMWNAMRSVIIKHAEYELAIGRIKRMPAMGIYSADDAMTNRAIYK